MPDGSTRTRAVIRRSGRRAEQIAVEDLVEPSHARLLASVPAEAGPAGRAQSLLDAAEVVEVLVDDQAPVVFAPVRIHLAFRQRLRIGTLGLLLERPELEDAGV